jgi:hypothetical protein
MSVRGPALIVLAGSLAACTLLVDRARFDDGGATSTGGGSAIGSGASGATTEATSGSSVTSTSGLSSSAGAGGSGTCLTSLFDVDFDQPTTASWLGTVFTQQGSSDGALVTSPTRHGSGAWRINLTTEATSLLRTQAVSKDQEVWLGFSQLFEEPATTSGTNVLGISCGVPAPTYVQALFYLLVDETKPGAPFHALSPSKTQAPVIDTLPTIPAPTGYADWALHLKLSASGPTGLVELYFDGVLQYRQLGSNYPSPCNGSVYIDIGAGRFGTPKPWAIVQDEIRLLNEPQAPLTDADALYTLTPGNCP